jgi:hypothetical protein
LPTGKKREREKVGAWLLKQKKKTDANIHFFFFDKGNRVLYGVVIFDKEEREIDRDREYIIILTK